MTDHCPMTFTYGAVDQSPDPAEAVEWQEQVNRWPAIQAYKGRSYELVANAERVLDVGCGPGTDAAHLGADRVIGVDPSAVMCRRTTARGVTVCRGDAEALPFANEAFDACRADRVVQHVAQPSAVIDELARVTRSGGRVVVADPDQESLTLHVPGVSKAFTDRIKRLRRDSGYRNGRYVSELPERFADIGLTDIEVRACPLVLTDPDDAFGLPSWPRLWRSLGVGEWTECELVHWDQRLGTHYHQGFLYALLYFVVSGTRP